MMKKRRYNTLLFGAIVGVCVGLLLFSFPSSGACTEKPIIVGSPQPMGYPQGQNNWRALTLAIEEVNAKGGVKVGGVKRLLHAELVDTRDLEPGVPVSEMLLAIEKLILQKEVDFIIGGPARSEGAFAMMDMLNRYKKVAISTVGTKSPTLHKRVAENYDKYKYFFKLTGEAPRIVETMTKSVEDFKLKEKYGFDKVSIMAQDVIHTRILAEGLSNVMSKKGWKVFGPTLYPTGATDFSIGLLDVKNKGVQLILIGFDMPEVTNLVKQWHDLKIPALIHGLAAAFNEPYIWKATEGKINHVLNDLLDTGNGAYCEITEWVPRWWKAYTKRWGEDPGTEAVVGYEGVYVLKNALERAGTLDSEAVIKALEQTDMMGVRGRIRFDPGHVPRFSDDPKEGCTAAAMQWQNGKKMVVWPLKGATASITFPSWMKVK